jgi:hypothetical protein
MLSLGGTISSTIYLYGLCGCPAVRAAVRAAVFGNAHVYVRAVRAVAVCGSALGSL